MNKKHSIRVREIEEIKTSEIDSMGIDPFTEITLEELEIINSRRK